MKRILIVSSYLPYPLVSGGHIRLYNLIKYLSKKYKITLICERRGYQTENDYEQVKKFCEEVITIERKKQWSIKTILQTGLSFYPFLVVGHTNKDFKQAIINTLCEKTFELIHVETFYVMQNLPKTYLPILLVEHNIEYIVYNRYLLSAQIFLKPLLYIDVLKMKYWEKYFWKKASHIATVSNVDKKIVNKINTTVIANGVNLSEFTFLPLEKKQKKKGKRILFIGDFRWIQNQQTATWIIEEIWPKIAKENNEVTLWIVGKQIPTKLKNISHDTTIIFDENAPMETWKIFHKAFLLLTPIKVGGGTSYKMLEAMATGTPVVTTSLGAQGLEVEKDTHLAIGDTTEALSQEINDLLQNKVKYNFLAQHGRKFVEDNHDWEKIAMKLDGLYTKLTQP